MKVKSFLISALLLCSLSMLQLGMARNAVYDEEAREQERIEREYKKASKERGNPAVNVASGVKQATVDSTAGFLEETAEATAEEPPIVGTLEGARVGSGKILDGAVKGAVKVATLGFGEVENYEVEQPEAHSEETTKITLKIPGT